ncbi:MAG: hypothetical protein ACNA8W_06645 [Bradymonadaceae bacterium]
MDTIERVDHQPAVNESYLDEETLNQLFDDIEALGQIVLVAIKGHGEARAGGAGVPLRAAYELFTDHGIAGVQIRYLHDGQEWWDTLMHTPDGVRLVRISHDVG